jgi:hypothetical protein
MVMKMLFCGARLQACRVDIRVDVWSRGNIIIESFCRRSRALTLVGQVLEGQTADRTRL